MYKTEKHQIKKGHKLFKFLDELASNSKSIYNMANYLIRQEFIKTSKDKEKGLVEHANWLRRFEVDKLLKESYLDCYRLLPAKSVQMILKNLDESWSSFFGSIKSYKNDKNKFKARPKLPNYKKKDTGRNVVILNNQQFKIKDGVIHFLSSLTKNIDFKPMKTNVPEDAKLIQITISPKNGYYNFNVVYEVKDSIVEHKENDKCLSIDLGINNLCTVTNNIDNDFFIINGKGLKSLNQWTNRLNAKLFSKGNKNFKNSIWRKRDNKIDYLFNKVSNYIVEQAISKDCSKVICGYNQEWKQEVNLGRKTNQCFVQIPFAKLLLKLEYKCQEVGLSFEKQEESYTSKCSFLDDEPIEKQTEYKGKRIKRGLFRSEKGLLINSDVNGSLNILRKYLGETWKQVDRVKGFVVNPKRINFAF